ncbi:MAG: QueT transporter family protein [Acholeplasmataceae bacterium]|nr:QueT transporter family protein [Acholeplasmataceae bacterium]
MKKFSILDLVRQATIASIYVVLVLIFQMISFDDIQFRVAEILLVLVLFDPKSSIGILVGTLIANLFSPIVLYDLGFGLLASILTIILMLIFRKKPYLALLFPSLINAPIIGFMLFLALKLPFLYSTLGVFIGQFTVTYIFGLPTYYLLKKTDFEKIYFPEK